MRNLHVARFAAACGFLWLAPIAAAVEPLKSGLQPGEFAQPFNVRDCTGPAAGKTLCYYCRYGPRPVVVLFARELSNDLGKLIKGVDDQLRRNRSHRMAAFVVLMADNPFEAERRLKAFSRKHQISRTPLTIYRDSQQLLKLGYQIEPRASATVMMWRAGKVRVNHVFAESELSDDEIQQVLSDTKSILE